VLLDQVPQRPGPGGGGAPAGGGGLDRPPPLGCLLPRRLQSGQGGGQVPGRERPAGLVGRLGDSQDAPGRLGGDGRVRPRLGAGLRLLALGGAVSGGRGGLAGVGRAAGRLGWGLPGVGGAARAAGLGWRGLAARRCRRGGGRPGIGDAGLAALDPGRGAGLLVREKGLPGGGGVDAGFVRV
jgi:hypothetical protein